MAGIGDRWFSERDIVGHFKELAENRNIEKTFMTEP
jgi:hypothetical protein